MVSERMSPIVAGVDGSRSSRAAWEFAAEEAAARVTPLILVHALADAHSLTDVTADDVLAEAVDAVQSQHPALSVTGYNMPGDAVGVLTTVAYGAGLLVVGHRGHGQRTAPVVGSVALRLVGAAPVPLIVHRPLDTSGVVALPRPVLAGIDPGVGPDAVAEFAFAEAALRGAPLQVMQLRSTHADEPAVAETLHRWSEKYPDVSVSLTARFGVDIAVTLAAASRLAQLVILGTASGKDRAAIESVARALVDRAGCPVAIVAV